MIIKNLILSIYIIKGLLIGTYVIAINVDNKKSYKQPLAKILAYKSKNKDLYHEIVLTETIIDSIESHKNKLNYSKKELTIKINPNIKNIKTIVKNILKDQHYKLIGNKLIIKSQEN